jgi:hypothetical protein
MTARNPSTRMRRIAWGIALLNAVIVLAGVIAILAPSTILAAPDDFWANSWTRVPNYAGAAIYTLLAMLIIYRRPRHTIGWLFIGVGFFSALNGLPNGLRFLQASYASDLYVGLIVWAGHLVWIPAFLIPITLVLQLFPNGRLPSRRWWPISAATVIGLLGYATSIAFHPWPWEAQGILDSNNPLAVPGSEAFLALTATLSFFLLTIGCLGSLAAVVVRFRRAQGSERQQMKWLVYTAVVDLLALFIIMVIAGFDSPIFNLLFLSLPTLLAVAIGIAILRHQLFDIDIIIRKTLVYATLTTLLAVVYFGVIVLLQSVLEAISGQQSAISIVISTLIIAALFAPLRRRVQGFIDRRFYRRRYDAEKTLAAFAQFTRDETDLEMLTAEVLRVTEETMQPEQVTLWLNLTIGPGSSGLKAKG